MVSVPWIPQRVADLVHSPPLSLSTLAAVAYFKHTMWQSCIIEFSERFGPHCMAPFQHTVAVHAFTLACLI